MKHLLKLTIIFSVFIVLFGFYELSYRNEIFAQSKVRCCDNGMCQYPDLCTEKAGISELKPSCKPYSYDITCKECADLSATGRICDDPKNSCKDANGNCYGWCYVNGVWQWTNPSK